MAAAKIEENAFDTAESLLDACLPEDGETICETGNGVISNGFAARPNFSSPAALSTPLPFRPISNGLSRPAKTARPISGTRATGKQRLAIHHGATIHAVAISPDGRSLATAGGDGVVRIWHAPRMASPCVVRRPPGSCRGRGLFAARRPLAGLLFARQDGPSVGYHDGPRSRRLAAARPFLVGLVGRVFRRRKANRHRRPGRQGHRLVVRRPRRGDRECRQHKVFLGHDGPVFAAAFSPDGRQVASAGNDKRVLVVATGQDQGRRSQRLGGRRAARRRKRAARSKAIRRRFARSAFPPTANTCSAAATTTRCGFGIR